MFIDAQQLSKETTIETDICIIGAGAAGITLAREFIGTPFQVCLLESGGFSFDNETQSLYRGKNIGFPYYSLATLRLRYFGGTTNHWAGACRPLDEIDFQSRPWVPYSGWPFDKAHLDPFYIRAHAVCQLGPYNYEPEAWETEESPRLPLKQGQLTTQMVQSSPPTRFGQAYREILEQAQNIQVYLFANAIELEASAGAESVQSVQAVTLQKNKLSIKARLFILATGAIENARLLLVSNRVQSAGLGNQNDLVGRFFMEHLTVPGAVFLPSDPVINTNLYSSAELEGVEGQGFLAPLPETLRQNELLNSRIFLTDSSLEELSIKASKGVLAAGLIWNDIANGKFPDNFTEHLWNVISDIDEVAIYGYERAFGSAKKGFVLFNYMEQAPNPDSRVTLTSEIDSLGMRRVQLDWRFGELEKKTLQRINEIAASEFGRTGLGRVRIVEDTADGWPAGLRGAWHQIGTTRMHTDPDKGVVDQNCRVHGIANLYVAGSSVFPTSGYANPTLTIVALALRLADHIKEHLI